MESNPMEFINTSKTSQIIQDLAVHVYELTRSEAPDIWIGRAWSSESSEHSTGRALDIIASTTIGTLPSADQKRQADLVVDWFKRNADELRLGWIIWDKQIWSVSREREGWRDLTNRNGISDWHQDHIHIYLNDTDGKIPSEPLVKGTTVDTTTKYATAMLNVWNAPTGSAWKGEYAKGDAVRVTGVVSGERTQVLYGDELKWVTSKWLTDVNPNPPVVTPPAEGGSDPNDVVLALLGHRMQANGKFQSLGDHLAALFTQTQAQSEAVNPEVSRDNALRDEVAALRAELLARDSSNTARINQISVSIKDFPEAVKQIQDIAAKVESIRAKQSNIYK